MIRHAPPPPEPPDFDAEVRVPGLAWLEETLAPWFEKTLPKDQPEQKHPTFPPHWTSPQCKDALFTHFQDRCAYSCVRDYSLQVDHYLSTENHPNLAYEWTNLRPIASWLNSTKGTKDDAVLDPYEVGEDWFRLLLPSMLLEMTDVVPPEVRSRAEYTLKELHLDQGQRVLRHRMTYYKEFRKNGTKSFPDLQTEAPLIAKAVERALQALPVHSLPPASQVRYQQLLAGEVTLKGLRSSDPDLAAQVEALLPLGSAPY